MNICFEKDHGKPIFISPLSLCISYPSQCQQTSKEARKHQSNKQTSDLNWNNKQSHIIQLLFKISRLLSNQASNHLGPPHHVTTSLGASQLRDEDWWLRRPRPWNWALNQTPGYHISHKIGDVKVYHLYIYMHIYVCIYI